MAQFVKDAGVWKPVSAGWVKDAGVWKPVVAASVKDGGVWKPFGYSKYTTPVRLFQGVARLSTQSTSVTLPGSSGDVWVICCLSGSPDSVSIDGAVTVTTLSGGARLARKLVPAGSTITISCSTTTTVAWFTFFAVAANDAATPTALAPSASNPKSTTRPALGFCLGHTVYSSASTTPPSFSSGGDFSSDVLQTNLVVGGSGCWTTFSAFTALNDNTADTVTYAPNPSSFSTTIYSFG